MQPQRNPTPNFYKLMAALFLVIGIAVICAAVVRHEWVYWAIGIMTIINAGMAWLKSMAKSMAPPRETKR